MTGVRWARSEPWFPDRTPERDGRWWDHRQAIEEERLHRAWTARDRYGPARASVRTWLYRMAVLVHA
ncbi:hypothetical protein GCM10010211_32550 [Streptomyces albospinus]|uniref:Transposase n=1 Tax=Streptomyces albospinus TaxID=285515 RepID=A0ABQ2V3X4_9ACTN|nr:hypothetical protein [Streptomyces albospinus]GGU64936.1 hypothetical protein GCM10010211_32550 [Streptomyces albospinus]